jgi:hypothetical protein
MNLASTIKTQLLKIRSNLWRMRVRLFADLPPRTHVCCSLLAGIDDGADAGRIQLHEPRNQALHAVSTTVVLRRGSFIRFDLVPSDVYTHTENVVQIIESQLETCAGLLTLYNNHRASFAWLLACSPATCC